VNHKELRTLLESVRDGSAGIEDAVERLSSLPSEDLGFAHVDHQRELRRGHGEAIFCAGKTVAQVAEISRRMVSYGHTNVLATRADAAVMDELERVVPVRLYRDLGLAVVNPASVEPAGLVCVCTAGTSDIPVAEEAALTAECSGSRVERVYDVGVAGIHRLFAHMDLLRQARVIIAVAGMEGALASVIGGLVACPVIALPTSIGYGASMGGLAALLSMLNSCAPGVAVTNIDNGFGAGYLANLINHMETADPEATGDPTDAPAAAGPSQPSPSRELEGT
jgi:NCAIR mutase (PurE)-related protein